MVQVRMFKDLIRQKEHMVLPDLAQDLAQVPFWPPAAADSCCNANICAIAVQLHCPPVWHSCKIYSLLGFHSLLSIHLHVGCSHSVATCLLAEAHTAPTTDRDSLICRLW